MGSKFYFDFIDLTSLFSSYYQPIIILVFPVFIKNTIYSTLVQQTKTHIFPNKEWPKKKH